MGIFGSIMDKIFHAGEAAVERVVALGQAATTGTQPAAPSAPTGPAAPPTPSDNATNAGAPAPAAAPAQPVDVEAVLTTLATQKNGGGNWKTSIVDLLKLLDLDSSLSAREQLAQELNVHAAANGSAEENIALHKAVMQKLAENGGKVPASLLG